MPDLSKPPEQWDENKKPWYNDGDRVAGLCATVFFIIVLGVVAALAFKLIYWLITGEWSL